MLPSSSNPSTLRGLRCPKCRYELTGLTARICPECGTAFDPAVLASPRPRRHWVLAIVLTLIVLYAPFGWLLFVNDDPGYIRHWMRLWPILPGLPMTFLIGGLFNSAPGNWPLALPWILMGLISCGMIVLCVWSGSRSRLSLILTMLIALVLSLINSWFAHVIFAA